jgi:hypothetical protein
MGHEKARRRDILKKNVHTYHRGRGKVNQGPTKPFQPGMYEGKTPDQVRAEVGSAYRPMISVPTAMSRHRSSAHQPGAHQPSVPSGGDGVKPTCLEPWCSSIENPDEGSRSARPIEPTLSPDRGLTAAVMKDWKTG